MTRPKKNCVVRVTAEKTLGRLGRIFFFFFGLCDGSHAFAMAIVFRYILLTIHCLFVSENANNSTMLTSKTHIHSVIHQNAGRIHYFSVEMEKNK